MKYIPQNKWLWIGFLLLLSAVFLIVTLPKTPEIYVQNDEGTIIGCTDVIELNSAVSAEECAFLEEVHAISYNDKWFTSADLCSWEDIGCNNEQQITELSIASTYLTYLPESIEQFTHLQILRIGTLSDWMGTSINYLPDTLGNLPELRELYLFGNLSLVTLPSTIGKLQNLSILKIDQFAYEGGDEQIIADLYVLPDGLGELQQLTELEIKGTSIEQLPESIGNLNSLETIRIIENPFLKTMPESLLQLPTLTEIEVGDYHRTVILPDVFKGKVSIVEHDTLGLLFESDIVTCDQIIEDNSQISLNECHRLLEITSSLINFPLVWFVGSTDVCEWESIGCNENRQIASIGEQLWDPTDLKIPDEFNHFKREFEQPPVISCKQILQANPMITEQECDALWDLYQALQPLYFLQLDWFVSIDICNWGEFIRCNAEGMIDRVSILNGYYHGDTMFFHWRFIEEIQLPETIANLTNLRELDIGGSLFVLPESLGELQNLQRLRIIGSRTLTTIPESIGMLQNLQELRIIRNSALESVPASIGRLQNLKIVQITHNGGIHTIPEELSLENFPYSSLDPEQLYFISPPLDDSLNPGKGYFVQPSLPYDIPILPPNKGQQDHNNYFSEQLQAIENDPLFEK